ncbi:P-loop NTPase [Micromonospora sp. BRA006-A]|nr:P-loop NTPase [Micromonospora sp. BRA006-A]
MADVRMRDGAGLQRVTGSPLLGEIPYETGARSAPLIVGEAATSARAEAVRKLRTNLRFVDVHEPARVIAVTSALQGEGRTTMACNTAIALAEAGWRVLLIDADLRRPKVADYLGSTAVSASPACSSATSRSVTWCSAGARSPCWCCPAAPPRPTRASCSAPGPWRTCWSRCGTRRTSWSVDTAPLLAVTDGVVVAVQADGALLVTQQGRTVPPAVRSPRRRTRSARSRCACSAACSTWPRWRRRTPTSTRRTRWSCRPRHLRAATGPAPGGARSAVGDRTQELTRLSR